MAKLPNLKGVATKDLVETIGSGRFQANYINWSRTMQLFRDNGGEDWFIEAVFNSEGEMLHRAPAGGYLLLRLRHLDGTATPAVPQAVMDNRNFSIPYEKISARDISDTHRRGSCLVVAMQTGLGHELWAKMPLENGYQVADDAEIQQVKSQASQTTTTSASDTAEDVKGSKKQFVSLGKEMGLVEPAIKDLIGKINEDYDLGVKTLKSKDKSWVLKMNEQFQASQY
jgi:hypothetical protein